MTDDERMRVRSLREEGYYVSEISKMTGIAENTIKTFCRRNEIYQGEKEATKIKYAKGDSPRCKMCGTKLVQLAGRKVKLFCSDKCRMKWWNSHADQVKKKAIYKFNCGFCLQPFTAYGNKNRKYCCHDCYISDRFGGVR